LIKITELTSDRLESFLRYLALHLAENGINGSTLFQPLTASQSQLGKEWESKFLNAFKMPFGEIGWRKVWIATNREDVIVGHIDIRHYRELNTRHRVLLGMGVDSNFRKQHIGRQLLALVIDYCRTHDQIRWLDLQVLSTNTAAIGLYEKMQFQKIGTVTDMFRISDVSYDYTSMTLLVDNEHIAI
jgi:RimJ/RimL family protein N-acetyltransferase